MKCKTFPVLILILAQITFLIPSSFSPDIRHQNYYKSSDEYERGAEIHKFDWKECPNIYFALKRGLLLLVPENLFIIPYICLCHSCSCDIHVFRKLRQYLPVELRNKLLSFTCSALKRPNTVKCSFTEETTNLGRNSWLFLLKFFYMVGLFSSQDESWLKKQIWSEYELCLSLLVKRELH